MTRPRRRRSSPPRFAEPRSRIRSLVSQLALERTDSGCLHCPRISRVFTRRSEDSARHRPPAPRSGVFHHAGRRRLLWRRAAPPDARDAPLGRRPRRCGGGAVGARGALLARLEDEGGGGAGARRARARLALADRRSGRRAFYCRPTGAREDSSGTLPTGAREDTCGGHVFNCTRPYSAGLLVLVAVALRSARDPSLPRSPQISPDLVHSRGALNARHETRAPAPTAPHHTRLSSVEVLPACCGNS